MARVLVAVLITVVAFAGCADGDTSSKERRGTESSAASEAATEDGAATAETSTVPDVTGEDGADAASTLEGERFTVTQAGSPEDEDIGEPRDDASGCEVVDQTPTAGEQVEPGSDVEVSLDCRQVDWENQEGDEWDAWVSGFESGVEQGCAALFALTPDGTLHYDDTELDELDCGLASDPDPAEDSPSDVPDDPESDGGSAGFDAGCGLIFESELEDELYRGGDSFTVEDCQATNPALATSEPAPERPATRTQSADNCKRLRAGSARVDIRPKSGKVSCPGAAALWSEYTRRAPKEGTGSSAVVTVEGWACSSAALSSAPRLGTCQRAGAAFEAYSSG